MNPVAQELLNAVEKTIPFAGRLGGGDKGSVTGAEVLVLGARISKGSSKGSERTFWPLMPVASTGKLSSEAVVLGAKSENPWTFGPPM